MATAGLRTLVVAVLALGLLETCIGCAAQLASSKWRRIEVPGYYSLHAPPEFPDREHLHGGGLGEPERRDVYFAIRGGITLDLRHSFGDCSWPLPSGWRSEDIRLSGYPARLLSGPGNPRLGPGRYVVVLCLGVPAKLGETSTCLLGRAHCETAKDRRTAEAILRTVTLDSNSRDLELLASPRAYHTTVGWGDLPQRLESYCEHGRRVWRAPRTYLKGSEARWKGERPPVLKQGLKFHPWSVTERVANEGTPAAHCSVTVRRHFCASGETIAVTIGRFRDSCRAALRFLWTAPDGRRLSQSIPPLFSWNVEGLWRTEHYLVLGLVASSEVGKQDERLAFWHLGSGEIVISPGAWWDDSAGVVRRDGAIRARLPGWRQSVVAEDGEAIVVAKHDTSITFWPRRLTYSVAPGAEQ